MARNGYKMDYGFEQPLQNLSAVARQVEALLRKRNRANDNRNDPSVAALNAALDHLGKAADRMMYAHDVWYRR